jgi:cytochrome c biogenesis protein CcmG/thiol:disulfide interchange protein DsbE
VIAPAASRTAVDRPAAPRRRRRRWVAALALLALVAGTGVVLAGRLEESGTTRSALVGRPAPALQGTTLDGRGFDLADWRGQVVLVNVWASWCAPCRQELPLLTSAYSALRSRGLHVVGIDVRDDPGTARAFLRQHGGAPWPSLRDPEGELAVDWGTVALPETYVVGRDGTVVAKAFGAVDPRWIDDAVVPLLTGSR